MSRLCFCPATSGGYGIVHVGADIPESQILMVSSNACGRHISISSVDAGYFDRISFYVMDESEVILGDFEESVIEASKRIVEDTHPRILLIYVCCSTYMAGLDNDRLRRHVAEGIPGTVVQVIDMNPVAAGTKHSPAVNTQRKVYELLDLGIEGTDSVNLIGSDTAPREGSEIYCFLENEGYKLRHLTLCRDYDDFLQMGSARLNIVTAAKGLQACRDMSSDIPFIRFLPSYSVKEVSEQYGVLARELDIGICCDDHIDRVMETIRRTVSKVGGLKIAVGSSATERPFHLARCLKEYGFNVVSVYHSGTDPEREDRSWLEANIDGFQSFDCSGPAMSGRIGKCSEADLAVGFNAGYFTNAKYITKNTADRGNLGFAGIESMMNEMTEAIDNPRDLKDIVTEANLVL